MHRVLGLLALTVVCLDIACAEPAGDVEVWLASTNACNSCGIYDRVAARRGYAEVLSYAHDGQTLHLPIRRVDKKTLSPAILGQLSGNSGPASPYWPINLVVIVVRGEQVLYFGNIAESADIRNARYSQEQMSPPRDPQPDHPALRSGGEYEKFFLDNWNLEYFASVALGDAKPRGEIRFVDLDVARPVPLARSNVILWGAADKPFKNAAFIAQRIREIRAALTENLAPTLPQFTTLYAGGRQSQANDTSVMIDGAVHFTHVDVDADLPSTADAVSSLLTAVKRGEGTRSLLVHIGHSGPTGVPLWGALGMVQPQDLREASGNNVLMVSGGCNSGIFARAVQCGFFAAHPEVLATGCEKSASAIEKADDYLRLFFTGINSKDGAVDSDHDGKIGLSEAHWYASVRLEDHQLSYTTIDALADEYFKANPARLPESMTVSDIRRLVSVTDGATVQEVGAMQSLTAKLGLTMAITLADTVQRNHAAEKQLAGYVESSSAERNRVTMLRYKLMLPMLARRVLYRSADKSNEELKRVTACEEQSITEFLQGPARTN